MKKQGSKAGEGRKMRVHPTDGRAPYESDCACRVFDLPRGNSKTLMCAFHAKALREFYSEPSTQRS